MARLSPVGGQSVTLAEDVIGRSWERFPGSNLTCITPLGFSGLELSPVAPSPLSQVELQGWVRLPGAAGHCFLHPCLLRAGLLVLKTLVLACPHSCPWLPSLSLNPV